MKDIKTTTKPRKRLFYNVRDNGLYVETGVGSNKFKDEKGNIIDYSEIKANNNQRYMDLSLFPAHIYKNYGHFNALGENKLVWYFPLYSTEYTFKKPKLIYITEVVSDFLGNYTVTYNEVKLNGDLDHKIKFVKVCFDSIHCFREVRENYQVKTTIKLL